VQHVSRRGVISGDDIQMRIVLDKAEKLRRCSSFATPQYRIPSREQIGGVVDVVRAAIILEHGDDLDL
jgi:hypothetical protein